MSERPEKVEVTQARLEKRLEAEFLEQEEAHQIVLERVGDDLALIRKLITKVRPLLASDWLYSLSKVMMSAQSLHPVFRPLKRAGEIIQLLPANERSMSQLAECAEIIAEEWNRVAAFLRDPSRNTFPFPLNEDMRKHFATIDEHFTSLAVLGRPFSALSKAAVSLNFLLDEDETPDGFTTAECMEEVGSAWGEVLEECARKSQHA